MRSRSVTDFRLESSCRARASLTRVIAAGKRSSICRSMTSSSFSHSLMARKAMREEFVSRSRALKAASRAMRQALRASRERSSDTLRRPSGLLVVDLVCAGRAAVSSSGTSLFRICKGLRGIENRDLSVQLEVYSRNVTGWLQACGIVASYDQSELTQSERE